MTTTPKPGDPDYREDDLDRAIVDRLPPPTIGRVALRLAGIVFVAVVTWHAVQYRGATALALMLPFAAEMVTAMIVGLVLAVFIRDPAFRRETLNGWRFWAVVLVAVMIWQWREAAQFDRSLFAHLGVHARALLGYANAHGMTLAMIAASATFVAAVVPDVMAYAKQGPPFVYLGVMGLATRLMTIVILCFWLFLAFDSNRRQRAEVMWGMLLVAELVALALPWIVQRKILQARVARAEHAAKAAAKRRDAKRRR